MSHERKPTLLCDHDVQEIVTFQRYLNDIGKLPPRVFALKWKDYMGLTVDEMEAYIKQEESRLTHG